MVSCISSVYPHIQFLSYMHLYLYIPYFSCIHIYSILILVVFIPVYNPYLTVMSMISIAASQLQFYQQKIFRLELQLIHLQEELITAKSKANDDYKIKYQILMEKAAENTQQHQHQYTADQVKHQQQIAQIKQASEHLLQQKNREWASEKHKLQVQKGALANRATQMELKCIALQRKLDQGDTQVLRAQLQVLKADNSRLLQEQRETFAQCQSRTDRIQRQCQLKMEQLKDRQKNIYRQEIAQLKKQIAQLQTQLGSWKGKVSPERQQELAQTHQQLKQQRKKQAQEIERLTSVLQKINREHQKLKRQSQKKEALHEQAYRELSDRLKDYQQTILSVRKEREVQLTSLQLQLSQKRQLQADELMKEIERMREEFDKEKEEVRRRAHENEVQVSRVRREWQTEKSKYLQEKARLKEKIAQLRQRLDEASKTQTEKLLQALKENDENQQFGNYENAITFMDRQVKNTSRKIQEKDRYINNLLQQMKNLQAEGEKEIQYTKQRVKQEHRNYLSRIGQLEGALDMVTHQLRLKDKTITKKEADLEAQKEAHELQARQLRSIIEEMERDYKRVVGKKREAEEEFRGERENVISGKVDINAERKKKWVQMKRQQNQLEIVYKERQMQLKNNFETALHKLQHEKHQLAEQAQQTKADLQMLKQQLQPDQQDNREGRFIQYNKQLATLDLEIALTQNLFTALASAKARNNIHHVPKISQLSEGISQNPSPYSSGELDTFNHESQSIQGGHMGDTFHPGTNKRH